MSCVHSPNVPTETNHFKSYTNTLKTALPSTTVQDELQTKDSPWIHRRTGFKRDLGKLSLTTILNSSKKLYIN